MGAYTGSPSFTLGENSQGQTETYTTTCASNTAGPQTFVAQLWDAGVTPYNHPPNLTSNTATVTWNEPTITLAANPTNQFSGQPSKLSYSTVGMGSGDYVTITGTGGTDMWSESNDTLSSDSYTETENPTNGGTTTVQYTSGLYTSSGMLLSKSRLTVSWTAPTITMAANPAKNVPGQPSTISYSVNEALPSGYTVEVTPSGNGTNMWSVSNQTSTTGTYKEVESPSAGQTIGVTYTGTILNSNGQAIAEGTTSVQWVNAWSGTITLSGNPLYLPTGNSTTLSAQTSQALPSGYTLTINDNSTGQTISQSSVSPANASYASYSAETDQFQAFVNDGFENVGNGSNTVSVVWSGLSLGANPTQLPTGDATTLTVNGSNVPSGDYLVVYNEQTGQTVGYSQSTPYSVQVTETSAETDTFVAYISSTSSPSGAVITSNSVPVTWYSLTLTANPDKLPINDTTVLTAKSANLPAGYVVDIEDTTTGQVIATGQPGQTVVSALQTKSKAETDNYVAQVVKPGNPAIPGLSYGSSAGGYMYEPNTLANEVVVINPYGRPTRRERP